MWNLLPISICFFKYLHRNPKRRVVFWCRTERKPIRTLPRSSPPSRLLIFNYMYFSLLLVNGSLTIWNFFFFFFLLQGVQQDEEIRKVQKESKARCVFNPHFPLVYCIWCRILCFRCSFIDDFTELSFVIFDYPFCWLYLKLFLWSDLPALRVMKNIEEFLLQLSFLYERIVFVKGCGMLFCWSLWWEE